jgi:hypothetical protein
VCGDAKAFLINIWSTSGIAAKSHSGRIIASYPGRNITYDSSCEKGRD